MTLAEADKRLAAVLAAPVTAPSRRALTTRIAADLAANPRPRDDRETKAAVAEPVPGPAAEASGDFVALVSDYSVDRTKERFAVGAFDDALRKLTDAGRHVPVLFGHDAQSISAVLGYVPPDGFHADEQGLWARGSLDLSDQLTAKIYKMLKRGSLAWSISFTLTKDAKGRPVVHVDKDGVRVLQRVDEILELSAVPVPANSNTRTVGAKANRRVPTVEELREREARIVAAENGTRPASVPATEVYDNVRETFRRILEGEADDQETKANRRVLPGTPTAPAAVAAAGRKATAPVRVAEYDA